MSRCLAACALTGLTALTLTALTLSTLRPCFCREGLSDLNTLFVADFYKLSFRTFVVRHLGCLRAVFVHRHNNARRLVNFRILCHYFLLSLTVGPSAVTRLMKRPCVGRLIAPTPSDVAECGSHLHL